jgi:hypothetical protein
MLQHATLETCILTTKMLCHIIPELVGVNVMPVGVGVVAANPAARRSIEGGALVTKNKEGGEVVMMCSHRGDQADKPGEWWGGHLILVADNRYLVDGSADQFNTPEVGVYTKPFVADLGSDTIAYDWLMGSDIIGFELPDGGCMGYEPHLEDFSYRPSMDWDETGPGDKMYEWVLERVRGLLEMYSEMGEPLNPRMLPKLPKTLSRKWGYSLEEIQKREFQSAVKLGYTPRELKERAAREDERMAAKRAKHTPVSPEEEAAEAEAHTIEAMETMEPKLLEAQRKGAPHWFDPAHSPLASSPPSSP